MQGPTYLRCNPIVVLESRLISICMIIVQADIDASDYEDNGVNILLDANENANGPGLDLDGGHILNLSNGTMNGNASQSPADLDLSRLNRYPDP